MPAQTAEWRVCRLAQRCRVHCLAPTAIHVPPFLQSDSVAAFALPFSPDAPESRCSHMRHGAMRLEKARKRRASAEVAGAKRQRKH
jgi:hypothetical protein